MVHPLKYYAKHLILLGKSNSEAVIVSLFRRRRRPRRLIRFEDVLLMKSDELLQYRCREWKAYMRRVIDIRDGDWTTTIYGMFNFDFLTDFLVTKKIFNNIL